MIVPTFDRVDLVATVLDSLSRQTRPYRAVIVDNASTDGTTRFVRERHPDAEVVALTENVGFGPAVNRGIAMGTSRFVVVLNNDVTLEPGFLDQLLAPLETDERCGMAAPLIKQADSRTVDSAGIEIDRGLAPFPRLWGRDAGEVPSADSLVGPTGAGAAYRRVALDEVRGFDERIFAYSEDTDLAIRLRLAGWTCALAPDAKAVHLGSASFGPHSSWQVYRRGWSRGYLLRKYGVMRNPARALRVLVGDTGSVAWQLVRTRETAGLRGRFAGWRASHRSQSFPTDLVNPGISLSDAIRRRKQFRG